MFVFIDCREFRKTDMSFDAFYGLSEPSSPSIVSKRKSTDDADANLPSPKRAHLMHEQNRPSQLGDTSDAGGRTSYWMVQWYGNTLADRIA